jgi:hypothetical protein
MFQQLNEYTIGCTTLYTSCASVGIISFDKLYYWLNNNIMVNNITNYKSII